MIKTNIDLDKELENLYERFLAETKDFTQPICELVNYDKRGFNKDNILVCLPYWLIDIFDFPNKLEAVEKMALGNVFGSSYILAQDRIIDNQKSENTNVLLLNNIFYAKWVRQYQKLFESDNEFWEHFEKYIKEYSNSVYWEKKEHWNKVALFKESDLIYLGQKLAPLKICCTAMCILGQAKDLIKELSNMIDMYHIGFQLKDDLNDWKEDLENGYYSYFLSYADSEIKKADPNKRLTEENIEEIILNSTVYEEVIDKSSHYLKLAKIMSDKLDCSDLSKYISQHIEKNDKKKKELSHCKKEYAKIVQIKSEPTKILYKRELYAFTNGEHNFVLHVRSSNIFCVDAISQEILDIVNNTAVEDVIAILQEKYDREEIQDAIGELVRSDILGLEKEEIKNFYRLDKIPVKTLALHISHDCNFRCIYCYGEGGTYGKNKMFMSEEVAKKAIDFLMYSSENEQNCLLIFFGGEPLMNFKLIKCCVEYGNRLSNKLSKKLRYSLVTNGLLLSDDVIRFLNENKVGVQVSMDGPPEIQNYNRPLKNGVDSYNKIIPNVEKLIKTRNGKVSTRVTMTSNCIDLIKIVNHLLNLGFRSVHVEPASGQDFFDEIDFQKLKEEFSKFAKYFLHKIKNGEKFGFSNFILQLNSAHKGTQKAYPCGAGRGYLAISPDGSIYPCHRFVGDDNYYLGNILDRIDENRRRPFLEPFIEKVPMCSECWARYFCAGGCEWDIAHNSWMPNKKRCDLNKHIIELAMVIYTQLSHEDKQFLREMHQLEGRPYIDDNYAKMQNEH